jgi:hypothetical protein
VNFLPSVLPISTEVNDILLRALDVNWRNRISIPELRRAIKGVLTFYADDVVFEGSMARCSWEAGIDITGGSQPEDDAFDLPQQEEPKSGWSTDSSTDIVFAAPPQGNDRSWNPYTTSRATWGADSDLRTNTPSQRSPSFLTYDDQETPSSSSFSMYSPALSGPYVSTDGDEDSTYVDSSERLKPRALSITTTSDLYEGSIVMRSTDSATMHTALESPVAYSSCFLQSSVSVSKPSFAAPSAFEVGISSFADDERFRDSMSWTRASTFDHRYHAESDLVNVSSMDLSPTEQEHTTIGHSPISGKQWQDFYAVTPPAMPQPQIQGTRLPFPLVPLKSSPPTTTPFQSPSSAANPRTKARSTSIFKPIKFSFPPRPTSPAPPVPQRRSAPSSSTNFVTLPGYIPHRKSPRTELGPRHSPTSEHTRGRRRHRQPLRSARDWLFSKNFFTAAAA